MELENMRASGRFVIGKAPYLYVVSDHEYRKESDPETASRSESFAEQARELPKHFRGLPTRIAEVCQCIDHRVWSHADTLILDDEPPGAIF
jgi:hypothetical protein